MRRLERSRTRLALVVLALAAAGRGAAQSTVGTVHGTVTDSITRQPVVGAQISAVGTTRATFTDTAGAYTLRLPPGTATLRAQRLGYGPSQRGVTVGEGQDQTVDFVLTPAAQTLSAVYVVGYGTTGREQVTGAVSNVAGTDVVNAPVASLDAALQGLAPGVQVTQNAGNPGNAISLIIRGGASISASNQPLYVIDGQPVTANDISQLGLGGQGINGVTDLDPNDIESITILKDASSTAIYGSRGSNGVVMITTKRGQSTKPRLVLNAYTGWQSTPKQLSLLNAQQYVEYMNEGATNDGEDLPFTPGVDDKYNTNWQDQVFQTAPVSNITLGLSGGSDKIQYYLTGSWFGQNGIVIGSEYNRGSARLNVDYNATDKLLFKTQFGFTYSKDDRIQSDNTIKGPLANAIGQPSIYRVRNDDGTFTDTGSPDYLLYVNSVALAAYNSTPTTEQRILGSAEAQWDVARHFKLTGRAGADALNLHEQAWESPLVVGYYATGAGGVAKDGYSNDNRYLLESFLTYDRTNPNAGGLTVVGGASVEFNNENLNYVRGEGFSSNDLQDVRNAARVTEYDGYSAQDNLVSFYGRANWAIGEKYLLAASVRADGSSRFGPDNRWGFFPAAAVGWNITKESWAEGLGRVAALKLRASYGLTGNQSINNFAFLGLYGSANYGPTPGTAPSSLANPNLKWETTKQLDVGMDLSFVHNRVSLIVDYYDKETTNLLIQRPVTATSGFTTYWDNVGSLTNRGWEFAVSTVNVQPSDPDGIRWTTDANVSTNHNEVTSLYANQPFTGGIRDANRVQVGQPLGAFYVLQFEGVDPQTGDAIYKDTNGDGQITADDRVIAGSPLPTWFGSFNNTVSFHGFDLRVGFYFSGGNKVFNAIRIFDDDGGYNYDNKSTQVLNRWRKPGDVTDEPRASFDGTSGATEVSSRFIENGDFLRLQELTLAWRLPGKWSHIGNMLNTKVYISGRNLVTWSGYSGYTPDVNSNGFGSQFQLGTDFYAIPIPRTVMFGITGDF
ncbi:MAG TPA: TonB-dependent receptor [Gemmatimonadaceae bacterium]|nr:TonB-dependent receptor [Gemmatimonadaceae bacterium]